MRFFQRKPRVRERFRAGAAIVIEYDRHLSDAELLRLNRMLVDDVEPQEIARATRGRVDLLGGNQ